MRSRPACLASSILLLAAYASTSEADSVTTIKRTIWGVITKSDATSVTIRPGCDRRASEVVIQKAEVVRINRGVGCKPGLGAPIVAPP